MQNRNKKQIHNYTETYMQKHNATLLVAKIKVSMVKILFWECTDNDFYFRLVKCFK